MSISLPGAATPPEPPPEFEPRLEWDAVWALVARAVARRSLCIRDRVGAVIVDVTQRIVATGYNGPPHGFQHNDAPCDKWCQRAVNGLGLDRAYEDCPALHAEANALSVCDRSVREGGTIVVTSHVCFACAKLIANSGLGVVLVALPPSERDRSYRDPDRSYQFLEKCGLDVVIYPLWENTRL